MPCFPQRLVHVLPLFPRSLQADPRLPADVNCKIGLLRNGVRRRDDGGRLDVAKGTPQTGFRKADRDDHFAGVAAGTPKTVLIVAANCFWKSKMRSKIVDRRGFTVVVSEDGRPGLLGSGKSLVYRGDRGGLLRPAEHIPEKLRQIAERNVLDVDGLYVPEAAIPRSGDDGKNGKRERQGEHG